MENLDLNEAILKINIKPQPDDVTCGPTCLHSVYNYYHDVMGIEEVIKQVQQLKSGGTLGVMLGTHALQRGYDVTIYTYNLHIFDPSWFGDPNINLAEKLTEQMLHKNSHRIAYASRAYIRYLNLGGKIKFEELTVSLLKKYLTKQIPILTGLSATYLYRSQREIGETNQYNDIEGEPAGHFVVINGYSKATREVFIADPLNPNPMANSQHYRVKVERLMNAIMLGILTYDANLLIIKPNHSKAQHAKTNHN
jgi:hypothetical protein